MSKNLSQSCIQVKFCLLNMSSRLSCTLCVLFWFAINRQEKLLVMVSIALFCAKFKITRNCLKIKLKRFFLPEIVMCGSM